MECFSLKNTSVVEYCYIERREFLAHSIIGTTIIIANARSMEEFSGNIFNVILIQVMNSSPWRDVPFPRLYHHMTSRAGRWGILSRQK